MIERLQSLYKGGVRQLVRYSLVGASGVVVNFIVYYICAKAAPVIWPGVTARTVLHPLPAGFNLRWWMIYSMAAFVVANLSNYQLNRTWSFKSQHHAGWFRELVPFFTVGLVAQLIGMMVEWALLNDASPVQLSRSVFDDSSGLRTASYWAHLVMVCVSIPVSFVLNKYWTFRAIRNKPEEPAEPEEPVAAEEGS